MKTKVIDLKKFTDFLSEYLPAMDEQKVPTAINMGGCGFFAYQLSLVLDKMKVPHEIIGMWEDKSDHFYTSSVKYTNGKGNVDGFGVSHIVIKINDIFFDAMGVTNKDFASKMNERVMVKETLLLPTLSNNNWNETFDKKQEPK